MIPYPKFGMGKKQIMPWWRGSEDDESSDNESREGHTGSPWGEGQIVPHQAMPLLSLLSLPSSKLKTVRATPNQGCCRVLTLGARLGYHSHNIQHTRVEHRGLCRSAQRIVKRHAPSGACKAWWSGVCGRLQLYGTCVMDTYCRLDCRQGVSTLRGRQVACWRTRGARRESVDSKYFDRVQPSTLLNDI